MFASGENRGGMISIPYLLMHEVCQPVGSFYVLYDEAYEMTQSQNPKPSGDEERPSSYAARLKKGNGGRIHQLNLGTR